MNTCTLTEPGKAELIKSLDDVSELLSDLAGHLKTLAHSGIILSSDALFAEEISKQFEELSGDVQKWVSRKQYLRNIGER